MLKDMGKTNHASFLARASALTLPMIFISSLTYADGSFLLQIGTFETQEEALKKWADVKSDNADIVAGLDGHVAEVMLPSDPAPSYRTQIGPVNSRREARTICKLLENRNVDCLLVETAFAASDLSPEMAGDVNHRQGQYAPAPVAAAPAPKTQIEASQPEDRISASEIAPVQPAAMPAPVTETQHTALATTRYSGYSNPNDAKKSGFFRGAFRFNDSPAPASEAKPVETAAASKPEDDSPGFFGRLFGRSKPKDTLAAAPAALVKGDVEVSEAIRVPVSSQVEITRDDPATSLEERTKIPVPSVLPAALNIEANTRLYWAQIRHFKSQSKAKAFYEKLTSSDGLDLGDLKAQYAHSVRNNKTRTSLRVGPFLTKTDVNLACASAKAQSLRCTVIYEDKKNELVTASNDASASGKHYPSPLEAVGLLSGEPQEQQPVTTTNTAAIESPAAASATGVSEPVIASQWIVLGNFGSSQDAFNHWRALQDKVPSLQSIRPTITGMLGSSASEQFQLRAGPFDTDVDAETTCKALIDSGNSCSALGTH